MKTLSEALARAVLFKKTKTAVAKDLGTNPQVLYKWENGKLSMPDAKLVQLAQMTGANPVELLGQYHYERWQSLGKAQSGIATVGSVAAVALAAASASLASVWNLGALLTAIPETLRIMHTKSSRQEGVNPV